MATNEGRLPGGQGWGWGPQFPRKGDATRVDPLSGAAWPGWAHSCRPYLLLPICFIDTFPGKHKW